MMKRRTLVAGLVALPAGGLLPFLVGEAMADAGETAARCGRLERRIRELRLRLRMGYTARQGRLWREQLAGLEAEYRRQCR